MYIVTASQVMCNIYVQPRLLHVSAAIHHVYYNVQLRAVDHYVCYNEQLRAVDHYVYYKHVHVRVVVCLMYFIYSQAIAFLYM